ncbi:phosphomannomutase [Roseibacterium sp. SDUM158016]|uniref:phosphomannomutase n=1 Tax=Roseicyclus sediminis TaxID=2980997 RepID=UPI0021D190B5|nr:phosphomannomutase [Roseibacterium sp. SDUM158016]MCU4652819.1 phosphomannomutase [Roseibacterium sp. SDUM158016]
MDALARPLTCFKAYDIRGRLGDELNTDIAYRVGRAFAEVMDASRVVIGRDVRPSSEELAQALAKGLVDAGVEVLDLGLSGTEETYFAVTHLGADGGICVTASHNPMDYNGMKMVQKGSAPIGNDDGMAAIKALAESGNFRPEVAGGKVTDVSGTRAAYVAKLMEFVDVSALTPLKVLVNAGNGAAGPTFDAIAEALKAAGAPLTFVRVDHEPDGSFPNGIPNPLLDENQPKTAGPVVEHGADIGVAWDGDFDRCFFFDHEGGFIPGEYVVGLLAEAFLAKEPGEKIVHDPRVIWATQEIVAKMGGQAVQSRCGHSHIKQVMRDTGAVYGGEMSAHHYFRDFMACDSGMIPFLLVLELLCRRGESLKDVMAERRAAYPSSGEVNFRVENTQPVIDRIEAEYAPKAQDRDDTDGLSLDFGAWRFNLRASNTEPLLRLNIESRGDADLVRDKLAELRGIIEGA